MISKLQKGADRVREKQIQLDAAQQNVDKLKASVDKVNAAIDKLYADREILIRDLELAEVELFASTKQRNIELEDMIRTCNIGSQFSLNEKAE